MHFKQLAFVAAVAIPLGTRLPVSYAQSTEPADASATNGGGNDDALLGELAERGMNDLLERAFITDQASPDRQQAFRLLSDLHRLQADPDLPAAERQQLLARVAQNVDQVVAGAGDNPELLADQGQILIQQGVDPQTGILEYWGATDLTRAQLHPLAAAAVKIEDRAMQLATALATDLANRITGPDDKVIPPQWQKATDLAAAAEYQKARMQYALALSLAPNDADLSDLITQSTKTLAKWDNADSGIQPQIRLIVAKLAVLQNTPEETAAALKLLDSLTAPADSSDSASSISPAPTPALRFEAECFRVIAELQAGNINTADQALKAAAEDQKANFPDDREQAAALRLLDYRLLALRADQLPAGAQKQAANAKAVTALSNLVADFPALRQVIYQELAARTPANASIHKINAVTLAGIVDQGRQLVIAAKANETVDPRQLKRSLAAARELVARNKAGKVSDAVAVEPSLLIGIFLEFLGDKQAAASALLDHIQRFGKLANAKADFALNRARDLIGELREQHPPDSHGRLEPSLQVLQDRFLPIAIDPPFNHREFALQYAASLSAEEKWEQAIHYYQLVPANDSLPRVLAARYGEMAANKGLLESGSADADKTKLTARIQELADDVSSIVDDELASNAPDAEKQTARATRAQTVLLAADIARREQNDPQRVLHLLDGFEPAVHGLNGEKELLSGALFLRVQAYMQLGKTSDATSALVQYLQSTGGSEGAQTVHDLLETLNKELEAAREKEDTARAAGDTATADAADTDIRRLAANRAALSGFLVQWAQQSTDPKIHGFSYIYERFDADTKYLAASLQTDSALRKTELEKILKLYQDLQSPENQSNYQATLDPGEREGNPTDPLVELRIGEIAYDLGDYPTASSVLDPLVQQGKLGENNDQYWQATYDLLSSLHEQAKAGTGSDADVAKSLKILYLIWRDGTGGKKLHAQFESLRKAVLPDWVLPDAASEPSSDMPQ